MVDSEMLSEILKAVSDSTRRSILTTLVQNGPTRVTDLAAHYDMSLNAVSKHIKVLESASLVIRTTHGRVHLIEANIDPVNEIDIWFDNLKSIWAIRLDQLAQILEQEKYMSELSLTVSKQIAAPIEQVYKAWLDPTTLARFMIPGEGMSVSDSKVDAREGGRFDIIMVGSEREIPHGGVYKALNPFTQIVFSWESPMSVDGSTVTLNFSESNGKTTVELTHVKFENEEMCANHKSGWTSILSHLEIALS